MRRELLQWEETSVLSRSVVPPFMIYGLCFNRRVFVIVNFFDCCICSEILYTDKTDSMMKYIKGWMSSWKIFLSVFHSTLTGFKFKQHFKLLSHRFYDIHHYAVRLFLQLLRHPNALLTRGKPLGIWTHIYSLLWQ